MLSSLHFRNSDAHLYGHLGYINRKDLYPEPVEEEERGFGIRVSYCLVSVHEEIPKNEGSPLDVPSGYLEMRKSFYGRGTHGNGVLCVSME